MIKIEIGHGIRPQDDFITVDIDRGTKPNILADAHYMPFADNIADEIMMRHVLEHFFWGDILWVLSECNRVLKPYGRLFIDVPNFKEVKEFPLRRLYDFYDSIYMDKAGDRRVKLYNSDKKFDDTFKEGFNHLCCFDEEKLGFFLDATGFEYVRNQDMERCSIHNWVSSLCMIGTKIRRPKNEKEINNYMVDFMKGYKWIDKYLEVYG